MAIPKSARWDPSNVMGSDCAINMVTGMRSIGKTYAMKKIAIKRYIEKGQSWAYVRYNDAMIERIMRNPKHFLYDVAVNDEFPDYKLRCDGRKMQVAEASKHPKWETFGQMYSLTSFDSYKGSTTPEMSLMVLDEFIKEKRVPPYPPDTVGAFFNLWETFDRREDRVRVVMLANAADLINPFFREWHITPIGKGECRKFPVGRRFVLYENAWSEDFQRYSQDTNIGAYSTGGSYDEYAVGNEFASASGLFVCEKPRHATCQIAIYWGSEVFGVWLDRYEGFMYVDDHPSKGVPQVVLAKVDMEPNFLMIDRTAVFLKRCCENFKVGAMRFSKDSVRENFLQMMELCGLH